MISVVIPAHNEAAVIGPCLDAILADATDDQPIEIVVVCNACTDNTAAVAATRGERAGPGQSVRVIDLAEPGKVLALNAGDAAATGFPRFYIDADVIVAPGAIHKVAEALRDPGCLAAAPRMRVDLDGAPWAVRAFFATWQRTGYHRRGMIGSGVYAVSEAGRARFDVFPPIIADDAFVRCQFTANERNVLEEDTFTVRAPRSLWSLVKIKTRSHLGNLELAAKYPQIWENAAGPGDRLPKSQWLAIHRWPSYAAYFGVKAAARWRSGRQFRRGELGRWERDDTTRTAQPSLATSTN